MKLSRLTLLMLFAWGSAAASPATISQQGDLRSKPRIDAPSLAVLNAGETVEWLGNEGGWSRIKTSQGKTGYVRMLSLRFPTAGQTNVVSGLDKLGNVARTGTTTNVSTTGVKGVTKEALQNATPNPEEVTLMDSFAVSADEARQAAKLVKLAPQDVSLGEVKK